MGFTGIFCVGDFEQHLLFSLRPHCRPHIGFSDTSFLFQKYSTQSDLLAAITGRLEADFFGGGGAQQPHVRGHVRGAWGPPTTLRPDLRAAQEISFVFVG